MEGARVDPSMDVDDVFRFSIFFLGRFVLLLLMGDDVWFCGIRTLLKTKVYE